MNDSFPVRDHENQPVRVWAIHDGKAGDAVQCAAIASEFDPAFETRRIAPRAVFAWLAPAGPVDPKDAPGRTGGALEGDAPDLAVASGRRAIPYARALKRASPSTTVVILKDPRTPCSFADLVWAPAHDSMSGDNILSTLTSPHGLGAALDAARAAPVAQIADARTPMLAVLLGGPTTGSGKGAVYDDGAARELASLITRAGGDYASIVLIASRRTPAAFIDTLTAQIGHPSWTVWRGDGDNPYVSALACAQTIIVPADSHNMISEALATGAGVYVWRPGQLAAKMEWFIGELFAMGQARPLAGAAPAFERAPLDATPAIVAGIRKRLRR